MRASGGTKSGLDWSVVARTNRRIASFAAPSFHEGSGLFPSAGPLELALRYSRASLDRDLFLVAASPPTSARSADTFTATFLWHYHPRLRAGLSYVESVASEGLVAFGGSQHDRSFVLRLDLRF